MALKSKSNSINYKHRNTPGFTIVELLVVIVVIAILAAIVIVSYIGISKKATEAGLQSDLKGAKTQLELYKVEHGTYPVSMDANNCPTAPTPDTNYCIDKSIVYAPVGGDGSSYDLVITRNNVSYQTTDTTPPFVIMPITGIGDIAGMPQVGQTLTAGAITPSSATASYQWQNATTAGGTYTDISGANSNAFTLTLAQVGKYIKVVATGTSAYTGIRTSNTTAIITDPNWITIGAQTWAKTNLNAGTRVAGVSNQTDNSIIEKYCYNDLESNCTTYGGLYQWGEVMNYSITEGAQGICPAGSHVPSDNDWKILEMSLNGMTQATADTVGYRGTDEGTRLKPNGSSDLSLSLAGFRYIDGAFNDLSLNAALWSSSESGGNGWSRGLSSLQTNVARGTSSKARGFSVRCLGN